MCRGDDEPDEVFGGDVRERGEPCCGEREKTGPNADSQYQGEGGATMGFDRRGGIHAQRPCGRNRAPTEYVYKLQFVGGALDS